jgi:hypothetical protein
MNPKSIQLWGVPETYIIDFQGFKNNFNKYIIKELAIIIIKRNTHRSQVFFVKSPYSYDRLSSNCKKQVEFNVTKYHGISWNIGGASFLRLKKYLNKVLEDKLVYVKGHEKALFLQDILRKSTVKDLDYIPSLKKLKSKYYCFCPHHKNNDFMCALRNTQKILTYIEDNSSQFSKDYIVS